MDTCFILSENGLSACVDKSHSYWQGWYKAKSWEENDYCPEFVLPMWEVPECTGMVAMEIKIEEGQANGSYLFILPEGPSFNGSFETSMNGSSASFNLHGCPTELVFSGTGVGATATGHTPRVVDRDGNVICDEFSYEMVRVE